MAKDGDVVALKSIDEHPLVIAREEIERLKGEHREQIQSWQKAVKERDDHIAVQKLGLQSELLASQDRCAKLQERVLEIRAAANKPLPS